MPVGDVLVCDARRHVEHLLACGVPDVKLDLAEVLWW